MLFDKKSQPEKAQRHYVILEVETADGNKERYVMSPRQARDMERKLHNLRDPEGIRAAERGH